MNDFSNYAFIGDLHLRSDKPYWIKVCNEVLDWFKNWDRNTEDNYLILAGDLVDTSINGGTVIDFIEKFYTFSKFKRIDICVGNHDSKKVNGYNQLAYEFLRNKPNVYIHDTMEEVMIGDKKALFLPYFSGLNEEGKSMVEVYSTLIDRPDFKNDQDFIVGHFCGEEFNFPGNTDCVSNLDKLNGRLILGHIHTRFVNPDRYIGSVFANNKAENDDTRAAFILDEYGWHEEKLPVFSEFIEVTYPEPLFNTNALVPIYTVLKCQNESIARNLYGDIFIRKTSLESSDVNVRSNINSSDENFTRVEDINFPELLDSFLDTRKDINETSKNMCRDMIKMFY